jgi:hypothetical protein
MRSVKHPHFDPLDLEIIDRVYEAAWAQLEAREPARDRAADEERQVALRKRVFELAGSHRVDFDDLYEQVMMSVPEPWIAFRSVPNKEPGPGLAS